MTASIKTLFLFLGLDFLTGCNVASVESNSARYYRISNQNYQAFAGLRRQLKARGGYKRYKWSQLHFDPYDTRAGYGLYFAIMPSKFTDFNVEIPCLISTDTFLISTSYEGKFEGDTSLLMHTLKRVLQNMPDTYNQTGSVFTGSELDSLRKVFLNGGFVEPKPGHSIHFR